MPYCTGPAKGMELSIYCIVFRHACKAVCCQAQALLKFCNRLKRLSNRLLMQPPSCGIQLGLCACRALGHLVILFWAKGETYGLDAVQLIKILLLLCSAVNASFPSLCTVKAARYQLFLQVTTVFCAGVEKETLKSSYNLLGSMIFTFCSSSTLSRSSSW